MGLLGRNKVNRKRYQEIKLKLEVFSFSQLQSLLTLLELLELQKISLLEVRTFVEETKKLLARKEQEFEIVNKKRYEIWRKNTRRCPTCMTPMNLIPLREPKGKANVHGYTCLWQCPSETCGFEEYLTEDFRKLYTKIMGGS